MPNKFENFSNQHLAAVGFFVLFTFIFIWFGKNSDEKRKWQIGLAISFLGFAVMITDLGYRLVTGIFDIKKDLPFFLCDVVVLILPLVISLRNRKWLGILYFWAVAGTLQALITPELDHGFPTFEYFRYFIMHAGIVSAVVYCIVVVDIKITWRDFVHAILYAQVYLIAVFIINLLLDTNYSYTMAKPRTTTLMDILGPWPWYILTAELLMIVLFLALMIPFILKKKKQLQKVIISKMLK